MLGKFSQEQIDRAYARGEADFLPAEIDVLGAIRNPYDTMEEAELFDAWDRAIFDAHNAYVAEEIGKILPRDR
jgi:hypothetical protein